MPISESVCGNEGHHIESFVTGKRVISIPGVMLSHANLVDSHELLCSKCGRSLEEIKDEDKRPARRKRTPKPATQEVPA